MGFKEIKGAGFGGINTDIDAWELPAEYISYGRNFRTDGSSLIAAGSNKTMATPGNNPNGGHIFPVHTDSADFWVILGSGAGTFKAQSWDGGTFRDISSALGAYSAITVPEDWTSCFLGKVPVANHPQHYPEYLDPQSATTLLQPLMFDLSNTWAAKGFQFDVIRSHKNYLFALNLTEGGTQYPSGFRWSHPAPINGLPASWDESDSAYIAGKGQIGGDVGAIKDGRTIRNSFGIYCESGVTLLDESGDEFIWKPRPMSQSYGVLNDKVLQEVKGVHFFLSDGDILKNDGNTIDSAIHNLIVKRLRAQINPSAFSRSFSVRDTVKKELWFCVAEGSSQYPDTAYVYNWADNKWSIHDLPYTFTSPSVTESTIHGAYGIRPIQPLRWSDFSPGESWASVGLTWAGNTASPLNTQVIGLNGIDGSLVELDPVGSDAVDTDFIIERTGLVLENPRQVCTVTEVYLYMDSNDPVEIEIGAQMFAGGPVTWEDAVTFDPVTDRKIDVLSTGTHHCYRVKSIGLGDVSISGLGISYELDGEQ